MEHGQMMANSSTKKETMGKNGRPGWPVVAGVVAGVVVIVLSAALITSG
jgi:threonine/homoserine/homoserine lactone efflux protein